MRFGGYNFPYNTEFLATLTNTHTHARTYVHLHTHTHTHSHQVSRISAKSATSRRDLATTTITIAARIKTHRWSTRVLVIYLPRRGLHFAGHDDDNHRGDDDDDDDAARLSLRGFPTPFRTDFSHVHVHGARATPLRRRLCRGRPTYRVFFFFFLPRPPPPTFCFVFFFLLSRATARPPSALMRCCLRRRARVRVAYTERPTATVRSFPTLLPPAPAVPLTFRRYRRLGHRRRHM